MELGKGQGQTAEACREHECASSDWSDLKNWLISRVSARYHTVQTQYLEEDHCIPVLQDQNTETNENQNTWRNSLYTTCREGYSNKTQVSEYGTCDMPMQTCEIKLAWWISQSRNEKWSWVSAVCYRGGASIDLFWLGERSSGSAVKG